MHLVLLRSLMFLLCRPKRLDNLTREGVGEVNVFLGDIADRGQKLGVSPVESAEKIETRLGISNDDQSEG